MTRPEDQHLINNSSNACRRVLAISACSILLALGMGRLQAQQDTLTGAVLDQSGQAIANAALSPSRGAMAMVFSWILNCTCGPSSGRR